MRNLKKKIILAAFSVLFISTTATSASTMRITALGGVNLPIMFYDPMPKLTAIVPNANLVAGGLLTADFIPLLKFDTGLLYKKTGFTTLVGSVPPIEYKTSYDQLFIPITARIEVLFLSIGVGAYYAFPLQDKITTEMITPTTGVTTSTYDKSGFKKGNFGFMGTLGVRFKLPVIPIGFMADIWYLHGLNELSNFSTVTSVKQSDLQVLVGVSLYL